jgi:hypothetical protein
MPCQDAASHRRMPNPMHLLQGGALRFVLGQLLHRSHLTASDRFSPGSQRLLVSPPSVSSPSSRSSVASRVVGCSHADRL